MKVSVRNFVLFSFLLIVSGQITPAQNSSPEWNPHRTWVFMVGLLEWKDSERFASFPQKNRRDEVLLSVLKKRGVPENQALYLQDSVATTDKITTEFVTFLSRARPGDTVFVYYAGHGYKTDDRTAYLASYDVDDGRSPGWPVASVPETIETYFKGDKAIIALDNCYSGSMVNAVQARKRRVAYAVMASSSASQTSTGHWTFTEAIISAFRGSPVDDTNRDGIITFAELESNAEADMLFGEEQVASFAFTGGFDPNTKIADLAANSSPRIGERVEAFSTGAWYKGYITDAKNDKFFIHYYGYEFSDDEWVTSNDIRVPKLTSAFKVGEKVEVEWRKKWYPAHILDVKGGAHYISYDNYDTDWNEWVSSKRIRKAK